MVIGPLSTRGFDGLDRRLTHRHRLSDRRQPTRDVAHSPVDGNRRPGPRHGCLVPVVRADRRPRRDRGLGQHAPLGRHPGSHERWLTAGRSAVTTTGSGADRTRSARPPQPSLLLELGRFDSALAVGNSCQLPGAALRRSASGDGVPASTALEQCPAFWAVPLHRRPALDDLMAATAFDQGDLHPVTGAGGVGERDLARGLASGRQ